MARIVGDGDLSGSRVLDIGCGAGGATVALLQRHGAGEVVGIDPMEHLIDYCTSRAERLGLTDHVRYEVMPVAGALPYGDASYDAIFSKDALLHAEDKIAAFTELHRILRPGGCLLMGDWFRGEGEHLDVQVEELSEGIWTMVTLDETVELVERCGFVVDGTADRRAWYAEMAQGELERFDSDWGVALVEQFGQDAFDSLWGEWVDFAAAAESGALSPGHIRATKPR